MQDLLAIFKANRDLLGAPSWSDQQFLTECTEQSVLASRNQKGVAEAFILYRRTPESFEISYLATLPQAKREGRMQQLLRSLAEQSASERRAIWLEVHEKNFAAIALYEKFGFRLSGRRPKYYPDGGAALLYNYG